MENLSLWSIYTGIKKIVRVVVVIAVVVIEILMVWWSECDK